MRVLASLQFDKPHEVGGQNCFGFYTFGH